MDRDAAAPGEGGEELVEVSGRVFGVLVRGRLPPAFATFLRPPGGGADQPGLELEVAYRTFDELPAVAEIWVAEPREPEIRDRLALFRQPEGFGLTVRSESAGLFRIGARRIDVEWLAGGVGAAHFFFSHALPLWLESRGVTVLHASAVTLEGRAAAFLGPSGAGKSTLCAELVRSGCGFVADDGLALEEDARGDWRCLPGPPWLRLWPSALEGRLGIPAGDLPRVHETLEKRRLAMADVGASPAGGPVLAAVYLLDRRGEGGGGPAAGSVGTPREALVRLVEHSLAAAPLAVLGLSGERLDRLARLAARLDVERLPLAAGGDPVERVRARLLADRGAGGDATAAAAAASRQTPAAGRPAATADAAAAGGRPAAAGLPDERLIPSPGVRARRAGEETVLLDLGSDRYFALDEVGTEIWAGLERGLAPAEILAELVAAFEAAEETVRDDLAALLAELLAEGLVRPVPR